MEILDRTRLIRTKRAFTTRRVDFDTVKTLVCDTRAPKAGDLVLARVSGLGLHKRIELVDGRRAILHVGDEVVLPFGNRYAPDQFEAYVPDSLEPCHMVAAGGIAARAASWHAGVSGPTSIEPVGLLASADGTPVNVGDFALADAPAPMPELVFAVFGTSMNAGKTTAAAGLVKSFADAGYRVGAAKITGTGAGGDLWQMRDAGAPEAIDFTDAGYAATFGVPVGDLLDGARLLLRTLGRRGCRVAVLEIADGLYQCETAGLAAAPGLRALLDGVMFAAGEAMGAVAGVDELTRLGHQVCGVSGALTASPLATREAASRLGVPVYTSAQLEDPATAVALAEIRQATSADATGA